MFHLQLIIDIQVCDSYKKAYRRLSDRLFESRARGVTASPGGTFNKRPFTNLKPTVSGILILQAELARMKSTHTVRLCVHGASGFSRGGACGAVHM